MKITFEFEREDLIRMDFIEKAINALVVEKEEIDKNNVSLYWENHNIYIKKMKPKDTYKIYFGEPK